MDAPHQQFSNARSTEEPLPDIDTVFWDIGGVVLTNGGPRLAQGSGENLSARLEEFSTATIFRFPLFDSGQITLEEYLNRTLFYRPRSFTREEFTSFMFAQSRALPGSREVLDAVTASRK